MYVLIVIYSLAGLILTSILLQDESKAWNTDSKDICTKNYYEFVIKIYLMCSKVYKKNLLVHIQK